MTGTLEEVKRNLRTVGQFDIASALASEGFPSAEAPRILEYTRYLIAINGCQSFYAAKIRAEIIAALWGLIDSYSSAGQLRFVILTCVEQLVRECLDIKDIHYQLDALAAAYTASFDQSSDLRKLTRLVNQKDFDRLQELLPPPDTRAAVNVIGRAYQYYKYGDMNGVDYTEVLKEDKL